MEKIPLSERNRNRKQFKWKSRVKFLQLLNMNMKKSEKISVFTLNYSRVNSPYQFYTSDKITEQKQMSENFNKIKIQEFNKINQNNKLNQQNFLKFFNLFQKAIQGRDQLNQIFKQLDLKEQQKRLSTFLEKKNFQMGTLDTVWNTSRYAPCHQQNAGVQNEILLDQQQFLEKWNKVLTQSLKNDNSLVGYIFKKKTQVLIHLYMCRIFDLCCFKTLVQSHKKLPQKDLNEKDYQKYLRGQKINFSQQYLLQDQKIYKILHNMTISQSHDIYCFQQVTEKFIKVFTQKKQSMYMIPKYQKFLKNKIILDPHQNLTINNKINEYQIIQQKVQVSEVQKVDSIILIKKSLFPSNVDVVQAIAQAKEQFLKQKKFQSPINFNKDSIFAIFQNNGNKYLILNVHLTSKKKPQDKKNIQIKPQDNIQYNQDQVNKVLQFIKQVIKINYIPIFVGDFNNDISKIINNLPYHFYPNNTVTTNKRRTQMQPQGKKAQISDISAKDFILSTMKMSQQKVILLKHGSVVNQSINKKNKDDIPVLPTSGHPFDHFAVVSVLQLLAQKKTT